MDGDCVGIELGGEFRFLAEMEQVGREAIAEVDAGSGVPLLRQPETDRNAGFRVKVRISRLGGFVGGELMRVTFEGEQLGGSPAEASAGDVDPIAGPGSGAEQGSPPLDGSYENDVGRRRGRAGEGDAAVAVARGDSQVSPPASGTFIRSPRASRPLKKRSTQAGCLRLPTVSSPGRASERKAAIGRAPTAARSLSPRARQR